VVVGAQDTTMSGSRQLLEELNHIGMRGILRSCRYETTWLKEGVKKICRGQNKNCLVKICENPLGLVKICENPLGLIKHLRESTRLGKHFARIHSALTKGLQESTRLGKHFARIHSALTKGLRESTRLLINICENPLDL